MSDEEYIIRREVEEDEQELDNLPVKEESVFDNEFRILVLANTSIKDGEDGNPSVNVEESDMEEILVRQVRTMNNVNEFFDSFDATIAEPNEGHLKYEVGSDGLCVVLVDSVNLKDKVVNFVNKYIDEHKEEIVDEGKENEDESERDSKRRR